MPNADLDLPILKCGVSGFGTHQELIKAQNVIRQIGRSPRFLIVGYFIKNDLEDDALFPRRTVIDGFRLDRFKRDEKGGIVEIPRETLKTRLDNFLAFGDPDGEPGIRGRVRIWLNRNSILYILAKQRSNIVRRAIQSSAQEAPPDTEGDPSDLEAHSPTPAWIDEGWPEHEQNLNAFKRFAEELGSELIFVIFSGREQAHTQFIRPRLMRFFESNQVDFVDLDPVFALSKRKDPKGLLFWRSDTHWNPRGNRLAALWVEHRLVQRYPGQISKSVSSDRIENKLRQEFSIVPEEITP